ncbi:BDN_1c_G0031250.mRNA.1.CDS.1 [Saccharomyces cerevisiae]|nr:BDN_1c_G0031250.mRNA.1.CDS.1 [Saccharomyces cerevisiae]CAI7298407.1 BDN_1c_G0031250.mRNA.1.CDS.1 [Saccharomyces cerevisiae]
MIGSASDSPSKLGRLRFLLKLPLLKYPREISLISQTTAKTSNQKNGLVNGYSTEGYVIKLSLQPSL